MEVIQDRDEAKGRVHHILGKRGHEGGGAYGCAENTVATTAGRGAVPTEHVEGTLSRIDYGSHPHTPTPKDPDHIRQCRGNKIAGSRVREGWAIDGSLISGEVKTKEGGAAVRRSKGTTRQGGGAGGGCEGKEGLTDH